MNWSESEESAIVKLYNVMAALDASGLLGRGKEKTTKAELIRNAQAGALSSRSRPSVEAKLMNVSYCRQRAGLSVVTGYKPLSNCSNGLLNAFNLDREKSPATVAGDVYPFSDHQRVGLEQSLADQ